MNADSFMEKLRERVTQEPGSKLFLALAEELKKRNEHEEALKVLRSGIEANPSFIAARRTLGRWYLVEDKLEEARREFSSIIEISHDDIYAANYLSSIHDRLDAGQDDVRRRTVNKLIQFRQAIHCRFAPDGLAGES